MEFNDILNRRYSCRAFVERGVESEKVYRILVKWNWRELVCLRCCMPCAWDIGER